VLDRIGPDFERTSGHKLNVISGFGPIIVKRINSGESFDMLVSLPTTIDGLVRGGRIMADTRTNLVRSGVGVEVRAGAPKPDISSVEMFKQALLNAKSVGYLPIGGVPQLVDRLGMTDAIKSKVTIPDTDIVSELRQGRDRARGGGHHADPDDTRRRIFRPAPAGDSVLHRVHGGCQRRLEGPGRRRS
jgi:molybdate transport system substrate-binding protein